ADKPMWEYLRIRISRCYPFGGMKYVVSHNSTHRKRPYPHRVGGYGRQRGASLNLANDRDNLAHNRGIITRNWRERLVVRKQPDATGILVEFLHGCFFIVEKSRSEERRVGKECRSRRSAEHYKKKRRK